MKFRKKPVVIEAVQYAREASAPDLLALLEGCVGWHVAENGIRIPTPEGVMTASPGDWIIKGVKGEVYPCKPDIFAATYEPGESPAPHAFEATLMRVCCTCWKPESDPAHGAPHPEAGE